MSDEMAEVIHLFKDEPQLTAQQKMYSYWEGMFRRRGLTLTDPTTAESVRVAIAVMSHILEGACATNMINEGQRDELRAVMHVGLSAVDELQNLP
ncbi:hypothetical protein ACFVAF_25085 [Streptomyces sp. NPDC057596]|uniref:hypothetical protein n=1 Tax=Streptomyces sp. NPDC057596 TaxID=3346178 RepID=UPI0036814B87